MNVLDNPLNPINKYSSDVPFAPLGEGSRGRNGGDKTVPSEQRMNEEMRMVGYVIANPNPRICSIGYPPLAPSPEDVISVDEKRILRRQPD